MSRPILIKDHIAGKSRSVASLRSGTNQVNVTHSQLVERFAAMCSEDPPSHTNTEKLRGVLLL